MYAKNTTILNPTGLHARPAAEFVKEAKKYESSITIKKVSGGDAVNAKSAIRLLGVGMSKGTVVEIAADGADETAAADALVSLIDSGFGE